ncbi:MAG: hypothetical protein IJ629_06140 [Clostridia bacterium]|nr:hypothetical protein [Clostridia bacterium]
MGLVSKLFSRERKEKELKSEIIVVDDNKELPDIRKIAVPDLKQYLIQGYAEIREIKAKNQELENKLEEAQKNKELYEATLVTLNEFRNRDKENKQEISKLQAKKDDLVKQIDNKTEIINNYKIRENELCRRENERDIQDTIIANNAVKEYKQKLIDKISNTKGNISKSTLINLIEGIK